MKIWSGSSIEKSSEGMGCEEILLDDTERVSVSVKCSEKKMKRRTRKVSKEVANRRYQKTLEDRQTKPVSLVSSPVIIDGDGDTENPQSHRIQPPLIQEQPSYHPKRAQYTSQQTQ